ncbi:uncharacterized protein RCC_03921 [Ramularia collo-cygni]|uniref:Uncharacterized protein n=1 Tax=Ramularia collo-cygni TaxID=112498 RepID=A0A2D3UP19_9PEZI|nr:uncharacterized protein RCC_03921 [Ramularia collo-cygni]CZT18082.1 uncharacterized protein RCC_03921 [Ramularia collo-cygni]
MKERFALLLFLTAGLIHPALTQETAGNGANSSIPIWSLTTEVNAFSSNLCGATFEDTNATGITYINPNVLQGPQPGQENTSGKTLQSGLAVTIQDSSGSSNTSNSTSSSYGLWYNTNGANYSGNFALGYDVCALIGFSLNYNSKLRGQEDDGTCSSALDSTCISDIKAVTQQWADWLTTPNTIGPGTNLTNSTLPTLCNTLAASVKDNFPASCSYFFQDSGLDGLGWALTSNGNNDAYDTILDNNCTINGTWQRAVTLYGNNSRSIYTAWAQTITPVLFAFMPVADSSATTRISSSVAELSCLRINNIKEGSYKPPSLPEPTPIAYNTTETALPQPTDSGQGSSEQSLTGGAIAGIAIGAVAGVAAIAGGLFFWLWRKRKARRNITAGENGTSQEQPAREKAELPGESHRHELAGPGPRELEGRDARHQLPATEEEGGRDNRQWLDGFEISKDKTENQGPVELP